MPTPGFILQLALGQMATELLLNGQHIRPKKLLDHKFQFNHSRIDHALKVIYKNL
jgi:NAD dependent epimerase/dehydratase family enzyme